MTRRCPSWQRAVADEYRWPPLAFFTSGGALSLGGGAPGAGADGPDGPVGMTTVLAGTKVRAAGNHTRVSISICRAPGGTTGRANRPSADTCTGSRPNGPPAWPWAGPEPPLTRKLMMTLQAG